MSLARNEMQQQTVNLPNYVEWTLLSQLFGLVYFQKQCVLLVFIITVS